jgi:F0F1-type ATP synthase epsilon subunit
MANYKYQLNLSIISPVKQLFSGSVFAISSVNSAGKFDILPQHANFITLVENRPISITHLDGRRQTFSFPIAIIFTDHNSVKIYTDISSALKVS